MSMSIFFFPAREKSGLGNGEEEVIYTVLIGNSNATGKRKRWQTDGYLKIKGNSVHLITDTKQHLYSSSSCTLAEADKMIPEETEFQLGSYLIQVSSFISEANNFK